MLLGRADGERTLRARSDGLFKRVGSSVEGAVAVVCDYWRAYSCVLPLLFAQSVATADRTSQTHATDGCVLYATDSARVRVVCSTPIKTQQRKRACETGCT